MFPDNYEYSDLEDECDCGNPNPIYCENCDGCEECCECE